MTWMRFDPDRFWSEDLVERMDMDAAGLLLWLISRSWKMGAIRDDPAHYKAILRGKCKGFDRLWPIVRAAFDECEDGLRVAWVEEERESASRRLRSDASRQALQRTRRGMSRRSHAGVTRDSTVSHAPTDETDETRRTVTPPSPRKRGATPKLPSDWWLPVFAEFPDLDTPEAREAFVSLLRSRTDRGDSRWTPKRLRSKLREFAGFDGAVFARSVALTESNGWKGCFPPKPGSAQNGAMDWLYGGKAEPRTVDVKGEVR